LAPRVEDAIYCDEGRQGMHRFATCTLFRTQVLSSTVVLVLSLAACGGGAGRPTDAISSGAEPAASGSSGQGAPGAGEAPDGHGGEQEGVLSGSATLTVGGETWTFDRVVCAFGNENFQQGLDFTLTAYRDTLQFYVVVPTAFGHQISLIDTRVHQDDRDRAALNMWSDPTESEFVVIDGKHVSGDVAMIHETSGEPAGQASFEAACL